MCEVKEERMTRPSLLKSSIAIQQSSIMLMMKENPEYNNAIRDIKNISIKISVEAVEHLIKNSIDKNKLEKLYTKSLEQTKTSLKHIKA